jgi:hypothetical protein
LAGNGGFPARYQYQLKTESGKSGEHTTTQTYVVAPLHAIATGPAPRFLVGILNTLDSCLVRFGQSPTGV